MNKKLITLAIAAAMVAPLAAAAETTLYGRLDTALVSGDDDTERAWDIDTGTTRIGVKGSEDLGNGMKAIFQAEWEFGSSEGGSTSDNGDGTALDNRLAYGGLSGGFGTIAIGRQWTPYYGAVDKTDIFNNPGGSNSASAGNIASANANSIGPSRTGNALAYVSPNFSGFVAKLALVIDRATGLGESDGVDAYNPSLQYDNGPISIGVSALEYDKDVEAAGIQDVWGVAGSYDFGMFKLIAQYEDMDDYEGSSDTGKDEWSLAAEANFGNNTIRALYGNVDYDNGDDMDVWAVGLQHNFSARTRVYAEYAANNLDKDSGTDLDKDQFSLGLRHDF